MHGHRMFETVLSITRHLLAGASALVAILFADPSFDGLRFLLPLPTGRSRSHAASRPPSPVSPSIMCRRSSLLN
jgi:hypothetical protein